MRPAEILNLRWEDISLEFTEGLFVSIAIENSKTSARKFIVEHVSSKDGFLFVVLFTLRLLAGGRGKVWTFSKQCFGTFLKKWLDGAGLQGYSPYSFKRGGASSAFLAHRSYDLLCQQGRWSSITAARNYLDDSLSSLVRMQVPRRPQWVRPYLRRVLVSLLQYHQIEVGIGVESLILEL